MLKTIAMIATLTTLAATCIAPAQADGPGGTGRTNGTQLNGTGENGGGDNGTGNNGTGNNGTATGTSSLSILAIELPPVTR
jgi:hypothetical protein